MYVSIELDTYQSHTYAHQALTRAICTIGLCSLNCDFEYDMIETVSIIMLLLAHHSEGETTLLSGTLDTDPTAREILLLQKLSRHNCDFWEKTR